MTRSMTGTMVALITAVAVIFSVPAGAAEKKDRQELILAVAPEINVFKQKERYLDLVDLLSRKTGRKVQLTVISRFGDILDGLRQGRIDAAILGSFTAAAGVRQATVVPLARLEEPDGDSTYSGIIVASKKSGIRNIADLRGKRFAFVDKATTAGYLFPIAFLRGKGISDYRGYFSRIFFSGSHDASVNMILSGKVDAGSVKNTVYEMMVRQNPEIGEKLVILARSPRVPSNSFCVRRNLGPALQERLKQALLRMSDSHEGQAALAKLGERRFIETRMTDYDPVMKMAAEAGIDLMKIGAAH